MPLTVESLYGTEEVWFHRYNLEEAEEKFYSKGQVQQNLVDKPKSSPRRKNKPVKDTQQAAKTRNPQSNLTVEALFGTELVWFDRYKVEEAEEQHYGIAKDAPIGESKKKAKAAKSKKQNAGKQDKDENDIDLFGENEESAAPPRKVKEAKNKARLNENQKMPLSVESLFGTEQVWFQQYNVDEAVEIFYSKGKVKPRVAESEPKKEEKPDDDDDIDLFGDDEPDPEAEKVKQQRVKEYQERKSKKPAAIAKSSVVLEVKPWDDETDLAKLESSVRSIAMDGLIWGASRFIPVAYGIKKLQIQLVAEDEKVSIDALSEQIEAFEDFVQSVDVAAFNKV